MLYVKSFYSFMFFYCIYLGESAHMEVKGQLAGAISVLPPRRMELIRLGGKYLHPWSQITNT